MPFYRAYGLLISSNVPLPALPETQPGSAGVTIRLGDLPRLSDLSSKSVWYASSHLDENNRPELLVWKLPESGYYEICYADGTQFLISPDGSKVFACWPPALSLDNTVSYLLGPVLGFALRLRGLVCLHASAVNFNGQVALFVGRSGAGKSTTATAFARRGYGILADDVAGVTGSPSGFIVQPAYPALRLWPETVEAFYGSAQVLPRLVPDHPEWDKCYLDLTRPGFTFENTPLPLARIYLLWDRLDTTRLESLAGSAALLALVGNTFGNNLLDRAHRAQEFETLGELVKAVPVSRLYPPAEIESLDELCELVLADMSSC